ncbi:TlpA family protein disulfide reductase, partial [Candidatus Actinomarina sp.]|nr:TlpA family protein disulfide reductase [Candidatus Actinomarina sp.]
MLKRNFILSILILIISVTYLTYGSPTEVEISENNNDSVELSSIKNITSVKENLTSESFIIVNLWASWCIPCIEEVDELKKLSNDNRFYVIGLLVDDSMNNGKEFIKEYDIEYE